MCSNSDTKYVVTDSETSAKLIGSPDRHLRHVCSRSAHQ